MKYLDNGPMFFPPPHVPQEPEGCQHNHGAKFNGYNWFCLDCGKLLKG